MTSSYTCNNEEAHKNVDVAIDINRSGEIEVTVTIKGVPHVINFRNDNEQDDGKLTMRILSMAAHVRILSAPSVNYHGSGSIFHDGSG